MTTATIDRHQNLAEMKKEFVDCFILEEGVLTSRTYEAELRAVELLAEITVSTLHDETSVAQRREVEILLNLFVANLGKTKQNTGGITHG